jgi:hypothetical protein
VAICTNFVDADPFLQTLPFTTKTREKMAGPPEERQKQLIYQREREREAVRPNILIGLMEARPSTNDNVMLFLK